MINILKAEFKKLFKGVLIYVLLGASLVFSLLMGLLYKMITGLMPDMNITYSPLMAISGVFAPLNNMGMLVIIIIIVIGVSEFRQRTIRNKLVGGYSRNVIYLTSLIKMFAIAVLVLTLTVVFTYLAVLIISGGDTVNFIDYLKVYLIGISASLVLYSMINLFVFKFNTLGKTLGLTLGIIFLISIVLAIVEVKISTEANEVIKILFPIISLANVEVLEQNKFLITFFVNIGYIVGINALGLYINNKTDYI